MYVYVVTIGEYDDYRIDSIYSSESAAQSRAAELNANSRIGADRASVEKYETDPQ